MIKIRNIMFLISIFTMMCVSSSFILGFMIITDLRDISYVYASLLFGFFGMVSAFILTLLGFMIMPMMPYLDAYIMKKTLVIVDRADGTIGLVVPDRIGGTLDCGDDGVFVSNPHAVKAFVGGKQISLDVGHPRNIGGVQTLVVYEDNAIPPETALCKITHRLAEEDVKSIAEWKEKADVGVDLVYWQDLDLKSVGRYYNYISPHYVATRIAIAEEKFAREYADPLKRILPWVMMAMTMLLIAAVAYVMVTSGGGTSDPGASSSAIMDVVNIDV